MTQASQGVINRRQLLRGNIRGTRTPIRPPWAVDEAEFVTKCSRCNDCIDGCEEDIILRGSGGFPEISFHEHGCSFCGDCLDACKTGALRAAYPAPSQAWNLKASILANCLSLNGVVCRACGDSCEPRAISFRLQTAGRAIPGLDSERCNGCGECFAVCPVQAVEIRSFTTSGQYDARDNQ